MLTSLLIVAFISLNIGYLFHCLTKFKAQYRLNYGIVMGMEQL